MMDPENENYYEYVIGGKTGYTSDALSTLVTMADNGSMQLVCVVLKTHGKNVYPDTKNLLEYAFSNFSKVAAADYETSEDIQSIGEAQAAVNVSGEAGAAGAEGDSSGVGEASGAEENTSGVEVSSEAAAENAGAEGSVILPKGVEFKDLEMEIIPDSDVSNTGTLEYRYSGNRMGSVRAVLSPSYYQKETKEPESAKVRKKSEPDLKDKDGAGKWNSLLERKTKTEKIMLAALSAVLVILVFAFITALIKRSRHKKRKN